MRENELEAARQLSMPPPGTTRSPSSVADPLTPVSGRQIVLRLIALSGVFTVLVVLALFMSTFASVWVGTALVLVFEVVLERSWAAADTTLNLLLPLLKTCCIGAVALCPFAALLFLADEFRVKGYNIDTPAEIIRKACDQTAAVRSGANPPETLATIIGGEIITFATIPTALLINRLIHDGDIATVSEHLLISLVILAAGGVVVNSGMLYQHWKRARRGGVQLTGDSGLGQGESGQRRRLFVLI